MRNWSILVHFSAVLTYRVNVNAHVNIEFTYSALS